MKVRVHIPADKFDYVCLKPSFKQIFKSFNLQQICNVVCQNNQMNSSIKILYLHLKGFSANSVNMLSYFAIKIMVIIICKWIPLQKDSEMKEQQFCGPKLSFFSTISFCVTKITFQVNIRNCLPPLTKLTRVTFQCRL